MEVAEVLKPAQSRPYSGRLLGDVLVDLGFCDREDVESAVVEAKSSGRPMGQILIERDQLRGHQLGIAIAERFGLKYVNLGDVEPDLAALSLVPVSAMRRLDAVPFAFAADEAVLVAMADPRNLLAFDDLTLLIDRRVRAVVMTRDDLDDLLERAGRLESGVIEDEEEPEHEEADTGEHEETADDGPTVKLVRSIIADAIEQGASDIHFDPRGGGLTVRYRIDGIMRQATRVSPQTASRVISRIKILSNLDISEHRAPQDGRMTLTVSDRRVDVRVAIVPVVAGEAAVLRILDQGQGPRSLTELGMVDADLALIQAALGQAHGAVLSTGPTGSGKSTSLYASLTMVSSEEKTIMTIEDPVEYRVPEIKQMQVFERAGVTFASGLRAIVRADPDVILVGEMRDRESAKIAIEAALTGHLVLSSLHTNSAPAAPARLMDMGIEPYLVASSLECVIGQRLVRRLCTDCRRAVTVPGVDVGLDGSLADIYEAVGCPRCGDSGYRGRVGLYEVMTVSDAIRTMIVRHATTMEMTATAIAEGMTTLRDDGLAKVRAGRTSLAEIARVVS